mgnify:CR=1 FL=1
MDVVWPGNLNWKLEVHVPLLLLVLFVLLVLLGVGDRGGACRLELGELRNGRSGWACRHGRSKCGNTGFSGPLRPPNPAVGPAVGPAERGRGRRAEFTAAAANQQVDQRPPRLQLWPQSHLHSAHF